MKSLPVFSALCIMSAASATTPSPARAATPTTVEDATSSGRLQGPLVFSTANGYVGVSNRPTIEVRALQTPAHGFPTFIWAPHSLERLLKHPDQARVTLPAANTNGAIINSHNECLSLDPTVSAPAWLPCTLPFTGQTWAHADGVLTNSHSGESLNFWDGYSRRGTFIATRGNTAIRLVDAVLQPVPDESRAAAP